MPSAWREEHAVQWEDAALAHSAEHHNAHAAVRKLPVKQAIPK